MTTPAIRIGQGYDIHRYIRQKAHTDNDACHITIGGVAIPHTHAIAAHSDGDVLLHALCDALLGAAAMGDIGLHFPDTDPQHKNANSRALLRHIVGLLKEKNMRVGNADATIIAQSPKMAPHIPAMTANIATDMEAAEPQINIKATTPEHLGPLGRGEGIAAMAVVLITPPS